MFNVIENNTFLLYNYYTNVMIDTVCPCIADLCGPLQPPENGEIVSFTNELRAGSRVFYRCNSGYELVGLRSFFRTCLLNASWSEQDPTCQGDLLLIIKHTYTSLLIIYIR